VRTHQAQVAVADRVLEALLILGNAAALKLRNQIIAQMQATGAAAQAAGNDANPYHTLRHAAHESNVQLRELCVGLIAGAKLTDPNLSAKLPDPTSFPKTDPAPLAQALGESLNAAGGSTQALGAFVLAARDQQTKANQAYEQARQNQTLVQQGRAANATLAALLKQGEAMVHLQAAPGTPAYQALHPKKKKKGAAQGGSPAPSNGTSAVPAAPPAPTLAPEGTAHAPPPAPTPVPAPSPAGDPGIKAS
jgi:hypothetical protein